MFALFFYRSDQTLEDVIYKLVPNLQESKGIHFAFLRPDYGNQPLVYRHITSLVISFTKKNSHSKLMVFR